MEEVANNRECWVDMSPTIMAADLKKKNSLGILDLFGGLPELR